MGLIFYLSSLSEFGKLKLPYGSDKIIHFLKYSILAFLLAWALNKSGVKRFILLGWVIASLYGITDEIHQSFVPKRSASIYDVLADMAGSFFGVYAYKFKNILSKSDISLKI